MESGNTGCTPQNAALTAAGVSLAQPERTFLDALADLCAHIGEPGYPDSLSGAKPRTDPPAFHPPRLYDPFGASVPPKERTRTPPVKPCPPKLKDLFELGEEAGLRPMDVRYIREWVVSKGVHWWTCQNASIEEGMDGLAVFRNPVVRRILNAAKEIGLCNGTVATKEELADWYTQRVRSPHLSDGTRDNAADKLAKLMGYYPDNGAKGGGQTNVQINFVNPYGNATVVDTEAQEVANG